MPTDDEIEKINEEVFRFQKEAKEYLSKPRKKGPIDKIAKEGKSELDIENRLRNLRSEDFDKDTD